MKAKAMKKWEHAVEKTTQNQDVKYKTKACSADLDEKVKP